jgi:hypothetical protein
MAHPPRNDYGIWFGADGVNPDNKSVIIWRVAGEVKGGRSQ